MTGGRPDFLSRIAAKAVGAAPLVEPRLPSCFEARREAADEFPRSWEESVGTAVDAEPGGSAPTPRRAIVEAAADDFKPIGPEAAKTGGEAQPPRPRREETGARPASPARRPSPAQAPPALVAQPAPASARAEVPAAVLDLPRPLLLPPAETKGPDRSGRAIAGQLVFEPVVPAMGGQDPISHPAPETDESDVATSHGFEAPVAASHPQGLALDRAARMPEIRPRPTRGEIRAAEHSPPRPVVNITIGRIEVRAHAAAVAPPARPAQPPRRAPQSLADYLKRRGGAR